MSFGPLAAELVEAGPAPVHAVPEMQRKPPGVKVRPTFAIFVDEAAVGEHGSPLLVEFGELVEGKEVEDGRKEVIGVRWAAGNRYDSRIGENVRHPLCPGRVRAGRRDASPRGARTHGHDQTRLGGSFTQDIQRGLPADFAVDPFVLRWNGAVHDEDEFPLVLLYRSGFGGLRLTARCNAQGFRIIE